MADTDFNMDALLPAQMAEKAEATGIKKAHMDFATMFTLAILAGAFVGLGAMFANIVTADAAGKLSFGVTKLLGGLVFCLGLILVVVAGAELFTGNNLIVMAWAAGKVSTGRLLRNWVIVWMGNLVGSVVTAAIIFLGRQYTMGSGAVGLNALTTANSKTGLDFIQALMLGIMCNALVCLAVWLCYSAHSTTDKIMAIIFPVTAFVAGGFEHSVANMYFIPLGLFIKQFAPAAFWESIKKTPADFGHLTWGNFFIGNLLPVTLGNIIGGALMVGLVYWFAYLRPKKAAVGQPAPVPGKLAAGKK
jgi:formate transporter